ncbi:hypothetical protein ACLB2K_019118 [Fragaria x ananassa]
MSPLRLVFLPCLLLFVVLAALFRSSQADVGTAAQYRPPYLPTSCFGSDASQFPSSNLFGSAGEGIWDNGAACGRQYLVRCISAAVPKTCIPGKTIQIKIVDRALSSVSRPSRNDATMVLSTTAFAAIANSSASFVNGLNQKARNVQIVDDQDRDAGRAPLYYLELLTIELKMDHPADT